MDRVLHILRMIVAGPLLVMFSIAAPVSTFETVPEEPEEFSENAGSQLPSTAPFLVSTGISGAAPPDDVITPGLTDTKATLIGLIDAVRRVHSRKLDEGFNYVIAFQELSHELRKKTADELRTLTPKEVTVEAMRDLAVEVKGEPDPQTEEEGILKANESPIQEDDEDDDHGGKRRTTFFPRI